MRSFIKNQMKRANVILCQQNNFQFLFHTGEGHQGHPVIDYKVSVSRNKRQSQPPSNERVMAAGLSKMFRRFSIDTTGPHHKSNKNSLLQQEVVE